MSKPLFSCVMPTWNREGVIADAITSIEQQTFKRWELIIVDDGSTDLTWTICKSKKNPNIRYYKIPHCGNLCKLRNYGNQLARGEIIVVQDSDDISMPDRLEKLAKCFHDNPETDIVYHAMYKVIHNKEFDTMVYYYKEAKEYDVKKLIAAPYIPGHNAYRKKLWGEIPYREEYVWMDHWPHQIECALKEKKVSMIDVALYQLFIGQWTMTNESIRNGQTEKDKANLRKWLKEKYDITIEGEDYKTGEGFYDA